MLGGCFCIKCAIHFIKKNKSVLTYTMIASTLKYDKDCTLGEVNCTVYLSSDNRQSGETEIKKYEMDCTICYGFPPFFLLTYP